MQRIRNIMSLPGDLNRSSVTDVTDTVERTTMAAHSLRTLALGHFPPLTQSALSERESVNRATVVVPEEVSRADFPPTSGNRIGHQVVPYIWRPTWGMVLVSLRVE